MSTAVVPRWEWRTFGDDFGSAEGTFAAMSPERVQESDELYLLAAGEGDTVKVRDGLMDVKHLERVNEDGLEQWLPVMKASFPLSAADVGSALAALGVPAPDLTREAFTLDELLDELVRPNPALLALEVSKRRQRYTLGGCMAELTEVRTPRGSTRTIAIETDDAALVIAAVRDLGLESRLNTSFPRGLKELVGFGARRYAAIDVGTNSVKFHIAERNVDGRWTTVVDRAEVTRLGEGLSESGKLEPEPMERTIDAIAGMAEEANRLRVAAIAAVGTAGLRVAHNAREFVDAVHARCGVTIEVIPGEEEARLAYLAAVAGLGGTQGSLVVFDTGGGSSQFTFGHEDTVDERFSVDVGAVRLTERYGLGGPVSEDVVNSALAAIATDLGRLDGRATADALVAMGGAVTNLAAVKHGLAAYDPEIVQGTVLDRDEVERQIEFYRTRTADERRAIVGLQAGRAEVILAGACIVSTVMAKLGMGSLTVSDRGLRHGVLAARFGSAPRSDHSSQGD
jgi:exopolyphosphatase/guanosine-5'-triphosphate,3'-diphosphate pyrophosphatase